MAAGQRLYDHAVLRTRILGGGAAILVGLGLAAATAGAQTPAPPTGPDVTALPLDSPIYETMRWKWNRVAGAYGGLPGAPGTRVNAIMLRLSVQAVQGRGPAVFADKQRIAELVDTLTRAPAFLDGAYTKYDRNDPNQHHRPGFSQVAGRSTTRATTQHISIDPEVALALGEAYRDADRIDLATELRERIRYVVLRVAKHRMFAPDQVRIGQLVWTANMLWAKRLVDGDVLAWVKDYRRALDTQRKLLPRLLTDDAGYRYTPRQRDATINRMDTPEYSLIALAGAQYLPQALGLGMRLSHEERAVYRRWMKRVLWGSFGNDGGLNWDTGWGADRRYLTQYWGWAVTELAAIGAMPPGFLPKADLDRYDSLCRRIQQRYEDEAGSNGILPKTLYGAQSRFASAGSDQAIGTLRIVAAAGRCPGVGIAGTPDAAASFDRDQQRYAITTDRYTTSVVGWSRDLASGVLPVRLVDAKGNAIGGLGGRGTSFDMQAGRLRLGGGYQRDVRTRLSAKPGSGPLDGRTRLTGTISYGRQSARVRTSFGREGWTLKGTLARAAGRRWRIPIPTGTTVTVERGRDTVLRMTPAVGSSWQVRIAGKGTVTFPSVARNPLDPSVRKIAFVRLPKGKTLDFGVHVDAAG